MWGEPREGTEAYKIKKLAEKRKKEAQEKKLDHLFSTTYRDCLKYSSAWLKNDNKDYVHPDISSVVERRDKDTKLDVIEFNMKDRHYKITTERRNSYLPHESNDYYDNELFLNGKKVFAVSESEDIGEWVTSYYPVGINAFVNEDWVDDFKAIKNHHDRISKEHEIKWAEDPEKTHKLKEDFGISNTENLNNDTKPGEKSSFDTNRKESKPFWKNFWFWVVVIIILLALNN